MQALSAPMCVHWRAWDRHAHQLKLGDRKDYYEAETKSSQIYRPIKERQSSEFYSAVQSVRKRWRNCRQCRKKTERKRRFARRLLERGEEIITLNYRRSLIRLKAKSRLSFEIAETQLAASWCVDTLDNTTCRCFSRPRDKHQARGWRLGVVKWGKSREARTHCAYQHQPFTVPICTCDFFGVRLLTNGQLFKAGFRMPFLRPTVLFGAEDIRLEYRWATAALPFLLSPAMEAIRLQPVFVDDR